MPADEDGDAMSAEDEAEEQQDEGCFEPAMVSSTSTSGWKGKSPFQPPGRQVYTVRNDKTPSWNRCSC